MPSGSAIVNKQLLGRRLYYDRSKSLGHCPDCEFWVRAGTWGLGICSTGDVTYNTRMSAASGSCDISRYREFCQSKLNGLKLFEDRAFRESWTFNRKKSLLDETVIQRAKAGIYLWVASHVLHSRKNMELAMELYETAKSYLHLHHQLHKFVYQYKPHRKRTRFGNA